MSDESRRAPDLGDVRDTADVRPFSSGSKYQSSYELILELPFYRTALDLHMQWIRSISFRNPLIIDAGGGTGIMSLEAKRIRPDAEVYLFDVNPGMVQHAVAHGFPRENIVISDISEMSVQRSVIAGSSLESSLSSESGPKSDRVRLKSEIVAHMLSHSVIWALTRPDAFFAEASRILRRQGTLAVSTVSENMHGYRQYFLEYLNRHLSAAVRRGAASVEQLRIFMEGNERLTEVAKSPLSERDLRRLGEQNGLTVEAAEGCYVIPTPHGPRPYFYQLLYRKL